MHPHMDGRAGIGWQHAGITREQVLSLSKSQGSWVGPHIQYTTEAWLYKQHAARYSRSVRIALLLFPSTGRVIV